MSESLRKTAPVQISSGPPGRRVSLRDRVKQWEGFDGRPYPDPYRGADHAATLKGVVAQGVSIGYGCRLPLTETEASILFQHRWHGAEDGMLRIIGDRGRVDVVREQDARQRRCARAAGPLGSARRHHADGGRGVMDYDEAIEEIRGIVDEAGEGHDEPYDALQAVLLVLVRLGLCDQPEGD